MIRHLIVAVAVLLGGCATKHEQKPLEDVVLVQKETKVSVPKETLRECDPLPQMEDRAYTESDVLAFMQQVVTPYADCKARKRDSDAIIRKSLNVSK
jgi:PBP1b-binding outer membrane lipoprotein LpoB